MIVGVGIVDILGGSVRQILVWLYFSFESITTNSNRQVKLHKKLYQLSGNLGLVETHHQQQKEQRQWGGTITNSKFGKARSTTASRSRSPVDAFPEFWIIWITRTFTSLPRDLTVAPSLQNLRWRAAESLFLSLFGFTTVSVGTIDMPQASNTITEHNKKPNFERSSSKSSWIRSDLSNQTKKQNHFFKENHFSCSHKSQFNSKLKPTLQTNKKQTFVIYFLSLNFENIIMLTSSSSVAKTFVTLLATALMIGTTHARLGLTSPAVSTSK